VVDIGRPSSQFAVQQAPLRPVQDTTAITNQRAQQPAGKAIHYLWDAIQENHDVLASLGMNRAVFDTTLNIPLKKQEALKALITG
jgi:hypothetical protein